ncbi:hypothetical protein FOZ60_005835 [Perkinsus olseni]|uniref:Uncharacterized protein n=1 Tax=Perkinsus olseni TaxID=32597 RepID=A0A7J6PFZ8_PEROL|nr:hypothetical protein FOZ60_005835 [Perkinsus olseni]
MSPELEQHGYFYGGCSRGSGQQLDLELEKRLMVVLVLSRCYYSDYDDVPDEVYRDILLRTGYCTGMQADALISKLPVVLFHLFPEGGVSQHPDADVARAVCQVYQEETRTYMAAATGGSSSSYCKPSSDTVSPDRGDADYPRDSSPEWSCRSSGVVPQASADLRNSQTRPVNVPERSMEYRKPYREAESYPRSCGGGYADIRTANDSRINEIKMTREEIEMEVATALSLGYRVFRTKIDCRHGLEHAHDMVTGEYFVEVPLPNGGESRKGVWSWGYKIGDDNARKWFLNEPTKVEEIIQVLWQNPGASDEELEELLIRTGFCTGKQAEVLLEKLPVILRYLYGKDEVVEHPLSVVAATVCQVYEQEDELRQEAAKSLVQDDGEVARAALPCPYPTSEYGFDLQQSSEGDSLQPSMYQPSRPSVLNLPLALQSIPESVPNVVPAEEPPMFDGPQKSGRAPARSAARASRRGASPERSVPIPASTGEINRKPRSGTGIGRQQQPRVVGHEYSEHAQGVESRRAYRAGVTRRNETSPPESTTKIAVRVAERTDRSEEHRTYVPVPTGRLRTTAEKLWRDCCCDARTRAMGKEDFEMALALALSKGYRVFRAKRDEPAREEYSSRQHGLRTGMLLVQTKADDIWAWGYALDDPKLMKYFPVDGHRVDEINMT